MLIPALLLGLPALSDNDQWIERLEFPRLVEANLNLQVGDADLGIEGIDLGFPDDPTVCVTEAHAKVEEGDRTARTLHQAATGLVTLRDSENLQKVLPACLGAYVAELRESPDDATLRTHFAMALFLAGTVVRDDRFFRDAGVELAKVAQAQPDDWRVLDEHARLLISRSILSNAEDGPDPEWLERAAELSDAAILLAPDQTAPHWRGFLARYFALNRSGKRPEDGLFLELATLADGLVLAADGVGEPRLALVGEAYWFLSNLVPVGARLEGKELPAPAEEDQVRTRLNAFRARLRGAPAGKLRGDVAVAWWTLGAFLGDAERWREDLELAIEMGVPDLGARVLALMGLHKRGEVERAAALAAELAESADTDHAWRALTVYRHELGDDVGALESLLQVDGVDPTLRLARAHLHLRTGDANAAKDDLTSLARVVTGTPLSGPVAHALGVALAVGGDLPGAKVQLTLASRLLGEEEGARARATLAELPL